MICVAYNDLYCKILHVSLSSNASEMFVKNDILNFELLLRKHAFSVTSGLKCSSSAIISSIESCWILKYVSWKPCHIDRLFILSFLFLLQLNIYIDKICNIFIIFFIEHIMLSIYLDYINYFYTILF